MFMKSNDNKSCAVYCKCGCSDGVIFKGEYDDMVGYELSLVSDTFNMSSYTGLENFKGKWKRILKILRNEEYGYFSLYIAKEDMEEFKKFLSNIPINTNTQICDEPQKE